LFIIWKRKLGSPAFWVVSCSLAVLSEPTVEVVEQTKMAEAAAGKSRASASELLFGRLMAASSDVMLWLPAGH